MVTKLESEFKTDLQDEIRARFPGCYIIKQDPNTSFQGVPDILVLWEDRWALLETKRGRRAAKQPNQGYYVETFNNMSFSAFINPENCLDVLDEMERVFSR